MPIFANINNNGAAVARFMSIEPDNAQYASHLEDKFNTGVSAGGSDHFISTIKDIDGIAQKFFVRSFTVSTEPIILR